MRIKGIGASSGIAIGKAFVLPLWEWEISDQPIDVNDMAAEFERLYAGIRSSKQELRHIKEELTQVIGHEESNIFDAHLAILDDPVFMNEIQGIIRRQYKAAEAAVKEAIEKFAGMFDLLEDQYMKERAMDIKDVGNRLIKHLIGAPEVKLPEDNQPFVLVAQELTPSQLAHLNPEHVQGIVTMAGGPTSHSAIMARAMGIPFVLGVEGKLRRPIQTGDLLVIDGETGDLYINPDSEIIERFTRKKQAYDRHREKLRELIDVPAITADGVEICLEANINAAKELDLALRTGIRGVGLFRTEFLYLERDRMPSEEEQYHVYRQAAELLGSRPMTIRTLDIGGDKQPDYLEFPKEDNPFLGYRAIRICLDQTELFKTQLRAILRASHHGKIKLMYPMISSVEEVRRANRLLDEAKQELRARGLPFDENISVGITIEVPAAAAIADLLAKEVDFFSIGTNDLTQYVLAVDRMNEHIAHMYDPFHPAVLRLLKQIADAARRNGIGLAVCGEMAGDARAVPIWLGLGIVELSMAVSSILPVKERLLSLRAADCRIWLDDLFACATREEIQRMLDRCALPAGLRGEG
jgi:phosphotransferase system enzyme I (PtsI)